MSVTLEESIVPTAIVMIIQILSTVCGTNINWSEKFADSVLILPNALDIFKSVGKIVSCAGFRSSHPYRNGYRLRYVMSPTVRRRLNKLGKKCRWSTLQRAVKRVICYGYETTNESPWPRRVDRRENGDKSARSRCNTSTSFTDTDTAPWNDTTRRHHQHLRHVAARNMLFGNEENALEFPGGKKNQKHISPQCTARVRRAGGGYPVTCIKTNRASREDLHDVAWISNFYTFHSKHRKCIIRLHCHKKTINNFYSLLVQAIFSGF